MRNYKKGIAPIIIALIVAVVIGGGYFIIKQQAEKVEAPTQVVDTSVAATSDWKTYTNAKYGFQIKYPATLAIKNNLESGVNINNSDSSDLISVWVSATSPEAQMHDVDEIKNTETYSFQGFTAKKITGDSGVTGKSAVWIIFNRSGFYYTIGASPEVIDRVLSTFKFTTPVTATSDWKTYNGTQYGFSIQYPMDTQISDGDISGGKNITFTTSQGIVMVGVVTQAWHNGVLSSPPNCEDTASGADRTNTSINGVNFLTFNMSKELSGMNSPTSATEYCAIKNGTAYKLITRVGYTAGSSNGLGLDKNSTLNQMVASFKFTK